MAEPLGGPDSLAGKLLVASPTLEDPNFHRTVVLVLAHGEDGALAVVLNRPGEDRIDEVVAGWSLLAAEPGLVFVGGPVSPASAICLGEVVDPEADALVAGLATLDLTREPEEVTPAVRRIRLFAGYAGWSGGQLESELAEGSWFVVDARAQDAMTDRPERLWTTVLRREGGKLAFYARAPEHLWLN